MCYEVQYTSYESNLTTVRVDLNYQVRLLGHMVELNSAEL